MCNFHESVAVAVATDPVTGKIHAGYKAVARVALSRYWAQRYVEGAETVNGYNPYPLATQEQQDAFERSGLKRPLNDVLREEQEHISFLRAKIIELSWHQDLSPRALKLPLPTAREAFMDLAIDHMYEGDPNAEFNIVPVMKRDDLQPLHRTVTALHADEKTRHVLERLVQGKICALYSEAPARVNQTLIDAYERLPERIKNVSSNLVKYGGNIALGGFSGIVGHGIHYGSVLGAGLAAGTASTFNFALSGLFLAASYGGWHQAFGGRYRGQYEKRSAFAVQAALTIAVAVGAQQLMPHDHAGHMLSDKAKWYESLPPETREVLLHGTRQIYINLPADLRLRLEQEAAKTRITPEVFLATCSGDNDVSRDIANHIVRTRKTAEMQPKGPS